MLRQSALIPDPREEDREGKKIKTRRKKMRKESTGETGVRVSVIMVI